MFNVDLNLKKNTSTSLPSTLKPMRGKLPPKKKEMPPNSFGMNEKLFHSSQNKNKPPEKKFGLFNTEYKVKQNIYTSKLFFDVKKILLAIDK
ncbi:MAG: hypothetical protein LBJ17_00900 [Dysgonamonadaceae bacterium]|nr:hypothetical protein [Dysgonamonadaceae bacterium]